MPLGAHANILCAETNYLYSEQTISPSPHTQPATARMCRIRRHVSSPGSLCFMSVLVLLYVYSAPKYPFLFSKKNHTKYNKTPILSQNHVFFHNFMHFVWSWPNAHKKVSRILCHFKWYP